MLSLFGNFRRIASRKSLACRQHTPGTSKSLQSTGRILHVQLEASTREESRLHAMEETRLNYQPWKTSNMPTGRTKLASSRKGSACMNKLASQPQKSRASLASKHFLTTNVCFRKVSCTCCVMLLPSAPLPSLTVFITGTGRSP